MASVSVSNPYALQHRRQPSAFNNVTSTNSKEPTEADQPTEDEVSLSERTEAKSIGQTGFLASTYEELKLVVWPSRQQLFSESIAVILMVTLSAASIAAVSRFYSWCASQVFP